MTSVHLTFEAKPGNLGAIRAAAADFCLEFGTDEPIIQAVALALDEAATNIIVHGYAGATGAVELDLAIDGQDLVAQLLDRAPLHDPTADPEPDLALPLEDRPVGGLGVHLIRLNVDTLSHAARPGGGNILTIRKRILTDAPED